MNKQELIDKLTKYEKRYENVMDEYSQGRYGAYKVSLKLAKRLNEQNITDKQAWNKVAEAYPESAQSLRNTLDNAVFGKVDEPQKPVVPQCVAEWIEYAKKKGDSLAISFKPWNLYGVEYSKADRWIEDNQETFARAWIDGYEVEEEPKYYLILPHITKMTHGHATKIHNISTGVTKDLAYDIFSEEEIKSIDERYWPFAVPVEEVAEG